MKNRGKMLMVNIQGKITKNNLKQFEFKIDKQLLVINNSNGTGKTTLLKCICNLMEYDGVITDCGKKIKTKDISYYFTGDDFLESDLSIIQNCRYLLKKNELRSCVFTNFEVDINSKQMVSELSAGNRQKLKLAITLSRQKRYYVLDEPTNYLDKKTIINFVNLLKNRKITGIIVIASNDEFFCNLLSSFNEDIMGEII